MRHYIKPFVALSGIMLVFSFGMAQFSTDKNESPQSKTPVHVAQPQPVVRNVMENPVIEKVETANLENRQKFAPIKNTQEVAILKPGSRTDEQNGVSVVNALSPKKNQSQKATEAVQQIAANYDEVIIRSKPVLLIEGEGKWQNQLADIQKMRSAMETAARDLNLVVSGSPMMVFLETRANSYRYEFMLPVEAIPEPEPALPQGMSYSLTPAGSAFRFTHKGAYKGIEKTYGSVSTYLASKNVDVKDVYMEEYPTALRNDEQSVNLVNIYVFPRQIAPEKPTL